MDGEEVTELYISHLGLKVKTPIRALKGFERTFIKAGQSKIVRFELSPEDLSLTGADGHRKELKGKIMISVGGSQPDEQTRKDKKTVGRQISII
jgi:beta-glucosidase